MRILKNGLVGGGGLKSLAYQWGDAKVRGLGCVCENFGHYLEFFMVQIKLDIDFSLNICSR